MKKPHAFQHPRVVLCEEHRPIGKLDWSIPKAPLHEVLGELETYPDGHGWTARTIIDGRLHRVRAGGSKGGPRSISLGDKQPGCYAVDEASNGIVELLAKAEAPIPCPLDSLDVVPVGCLAVDIPGWSGWGDEPSEEWDDTVVIEVPHA